MVSAPVGHLSAAVLEPPAKFLVAIRGVDAAVDVEQVADDVDAGLVDVADPGTAAAADVDETELLELLQRLAHRGAVGRVARGQLALGGQAVTTIRSVRRCIEQ